MSSEEEATIIERMMLRGMTEDEARYAHGVFARDGWPGAPARTRASWMPEHLREWCNWCGRDVWNVTGLRCAHLEAQIRHIGKPPSGFSSI